MNDPDTPGVPIEPVLPLHEIQGIAVPGFFKPHQTLLGLTLPSRQAVLNFRQLLSGWPISNGEETLLDRRHHREREQGRRGAKTEEFKAAVLTAVGFTYAGLSKLTPSAWMIPSEAYRVGLAVRSALLGDPTEPGSKGHPAHWKVGGPDNPVDAMFILAGNERSPVDDEARRLRERLIGWGVEIVYEEAGDVRSDLKGHEHFGFDDGVSQPGIRGRTNVAPNDFITPRHIGKAEPEAHLFGFPGQDLIWPGEIVLGHPSTSPDPLIPGVTTAPIPTWTQNGSFLVFRRLQQDVGLFWRTMRDKAQALNTVSGFAGMTAERLAALLVGRWASGAPINRVPLADNSDLGNRRLANNHFRFDSDSAMLPLKSGYRDPFPLAKADPAGVTCPWAAHIRKVNTRDSASDLGGRDSTYMRRILRVGVPFGEPLEDKYATLDQDPLQGDRGLLFLCVQSSIEQQFEFLVSRWMGDASRPKMPGGHDMLVGQNDTPGEGRMRRCVLFGERAQQALLEIDAQWIMPTGGEYFFLPSLTSLRKVLASS